MSSNLWSLKTDSAVLWYYIFGGKVLLLFTFYGACHSNRFAVHRDNVPLAQAQTIPAVGTVLCHMLAQCEFKTRCCLSVFNIIHVTFHWAALHRQEDPCHIYLTAKRTNNQICVFVCLPVCLRLSVCIFTSHWLTRAFAVGETSPGQLQ